MVGLYNFLSKYEQDGFGLFLFKDGVAGSIAACFKLRGFEHRYLTAEEKKIRTAGMYNILDSLPTFKKKKGMLYQVILEPEYDFSKECDEMKALSLRNEEYKYLYEGLTNERIELIQSLAKAGAIRYDNTYLICRYYPGGAFVKGIGYAVKSEQSLINDYMFTLEDAVNEFKKIEALFSDYSPVRTGLVEMINILRGHYGMSKVGGYCKDQTLSSTVFTKKLDATNNDRIIVGNGERKKFLKTYSMSGLFGYLPFMGAWLWDMPGDFRFTYSFYIPESREMVKSLKGREFRKSFILAFGLLKRLSDEDQVESFFEYVRAAVKHIWKSKEKRAWVSGHLTLISDKERDKREYTNIEPYFSNANIDFFEEKDCQRTINMSASPFGYASTILQSLFRERTIRLSGFAHMFPTYHNPRGSRLPVNVYLTNQSIYKADPWDIRFPAWNKLIIGPTGSGKTFYVLGEIITEHMLKHNVIYISSKPEAKTLVETLGGVHNDLSLDGSDKLPPFVMPERAKDVDIEGKNLYAIIMSQNVGILQFMTGNFEKDVEYDYNILLQRLFDENGGKKVVSVTRVGEELEKMKMKKEYKAVMRFSSQCPAGKLFDGEEDTLDIFNTTLMSISTANVKDLSEDYFTLVMKILSTRVISLMAKKEERTSAFLDELKVPLQIPEIAKSIGMMATQVRAQNTRIVLIDQDFAVWRNENGELKEFARMVIDNVSSKTILGLISDDDSTAKLLGLNTAEEEVCRLLKVGMFYYITPFERLMLEERSTPLNYAMRTSHSDERKIINYLYTKLVGKSKHKRNSRMKSLTQFSGVLPFGIARHTDWEELYVKNNNSAVNAFLEIERKGERDGRKEEVKNAV